MMKCLLGVTCIVLIGAPCSAQGTSSWTYSVTTEGSRRLVGQAIATTPNGTTKSSLRFSTSAGKNPTYTVVFCIENPGNITNSNFDDFEGPGATAIGNLMKIQFVSGNDKIELRFNPAGNYISQPTDGFEFSAYWTGRRNKLFRLIEHASNTAGKISISIVDSRDPERVIRSEFVTAGHENDFRRLR